MPKIPRSGQVAAAIRDVRRELKAAVVAANRQAAKRLSRGDYGTAQGMIQVAQAVAAFDKRVAAIQAEWKGLRTGGDGKVAEKRASNPLWAFYQPILQSLVTLGGSATRQELEQQLENADKSWMKEGDLAKDASGAPRWKRLVGRAKKHMVAEGFIEADGGRVWQITKKGEQTARAGRRE